MSEIIHSVILDFYHILDTATVLTEEVDTRLDGEYLARAELSAEGTEGEAWCLMNEETDRVTQRVTECTVVLRV